MVGSFKCFAKSEDGVRIEVGVTDREDTEIATKSSQHTPLTNKKGLLCEFIHQQP